MQSVRHLWGPLAIDSLQPSLFNICLCILFGATYGLFSMPIARNRPCLSISSKQYGFLIGVSPEKNDQQPSSLSKLVFSPGGHYWGCYAGALSSMSDRYDSPGDRVPVDDIYGHSTFGELRWIELNDGALVWQSQWWLQGYVPKLFGIICDHINVSILL